jgi:hypothetical protein
VRAVPGLIVLAALAALVAGCTPGGGGDSVGPVRLSPPAPVATGPGPLDPGRLTVTHPTVWLCRPELTGNPCDGNLDATLVTRDGRSVEPFTPAPDPPVDCFYVYPTVSRAKSTNAPLASAPEIVETARAQAARFASACKLYVPIYRQITALGLITGKISDQSARELAHSDVVSAWHDYLLHYNHSRKVVLIGHSQGTLELTQLIQEEIDGNSAERERLLSALLIGGFVQVPPGQDVGGSFKHIPACRKPDQVGCVVAYNSYGSVPPPDSIFGRPSGNLEVLCVNPAAMAGGTGHPRPYIPTDTIGAVAAARLGGVGAGRRGFIAFPDALTTGCRRQNGVNWLQVSVVAGTSLPSTLLRPTLGPAWGLHRGDITLALGDLTALVAAQAKAAG